MSLNGLVDAVVADPHWLRRSRPRSWPASGRTWTWSGRPPPGRSPSRRSPPRRSRTVLAVTATGREAEDLVAALRSLLPPDERRGVPGLGDAAARAALARAATPSAGGWPCCAGSRTPRRRPGDRAGRRSSSRRCAPCCSRRSPGLGDLEPVALRSGRRASTSTTSSSGWRQPPTPGSTWSRSAASSPCAAASSTSSRRPRSTRCGSSSGATRSRRSATSRSPTSARSRSPSTGCGRRRAASCCSPTRCARGPPSWPTEHPELAELLDKLAEGIAVEGMESLAPVLVDDMELLLDELPAGTPRRACATPSGCAPGPHDLVAHQRRSSSRRPGRPRPAAARRRSTSARRPTATSPTCASRRRRARACRGGR